MTTRCLTAALLVLAAGCSEEAPPPTENGPMWTADGAPSGPRLWLDTTREAGAVDLTLWAAELGDVFGWSVHLASDPGLGGRGSSEAR